MCSSEPLERGAIYLAVGQEYLEEARISARSVKRFMPELKTVLFTDTMPLDQDVFDEIIQLETVHPRPHLNKLTCLMESPFTQTAFLDTDTFVCGDFSELFDLLDHFDIAMSHDRRYYDWFPENTSVPDAFREFNQGVIVFKQSAKLHRTFAQAFLWAERIYSGTERKPTDQPPLRIALYLSDIRIATLTHEYNCRYHSFGCLNGSVKILHGRIPGHLFTESNLSCIAARMNERTIPRVFVGGEIYALEQRSFLGASYSHPKRAATLFRPGLAFIKNIARRGMGILRQEGIPGVVKHLVDKVSFR